MAERPQPSERVYVGTGRPDRFQHSRYERPELTPGEQARMEFFRDAFEVGRQSYDKETRDAGGTQRQIALRGVDLLNEALEHPFDVGQRILSVDAYVRQKIGLEGKRVPLRTRGLRLFANAALGAAASAIDSLDLRLIQSSPGPWYQRIAAINKPTTLDTRDVTGTTSLVRELAGNAVRRVRPNCAQGVGGILTTGGKPSRLAGTYAAGLEFILDEAVSLGADKTVQKLTKSRAGYASPLAHTIYNISRVIPVADAFINPVLIESAFRMGSNVPLYGAPVEWLYKKLNDELRQSTPASRFAYGLANSMIQGQVQHERVLEQHERQENRGQPLESRLQGLELQAHIQAMNEQALAEAIVTGEIPEEMRNAILETKARRAAQEAAASAEGQAPPESGTPQS